jgi:hypothetical protein
MITLLAEVLRYKPKGRAFDPDGNGMEIFSDNRSGCTMALGPNQPPKEMSISWGVKATGV